jgi:peptide/nickel transport system substrate-binding protein
VGLSLTLSAACSSSGSKSTTNTSAPGSTAAVAGPTRKTLNLAFLQDPGQPPDPAVFYAGQGLLLQDNIYDSLLQYQPGTPDRKIIAGLATSWTVSPDFKTYTLKLRQGVVFHDGTPFTSAAVGPSFDRDNAVNGGPAYMSQVVSSVQAPDPQTAVITLTSPTTVFLDYLASPYGPRIYSPTGLTAHNGTDHAQAYLQTHDLGSGPYTLTKAQVGVAYEMQAFPQYWGQQPYYTTINMPVIGDFNTLLLEFQNGQLDGILHDLTTQAIDSLRNNPKYKVYVLPTLQADYALLNPNNGFLTSAANRVAVLKALDLQQIVNSVYKGRGTVATQVYPHNLLPAGLASQAGTTRDPSVLAGIVSKLPGSQKNFTIGYDSGSPDNALIAEIVTNQLSAAGLNVKSVGYPTSQIFSWAPPNSPNGAPDMLITYTWPDAYTAYQFAHISIDPNGGINYLHCSVPNSADNLAKAVATDDNALFAQVGNEALQAGCLMNLVNYNDTFAMQPWLKGVAEGHVVDAPNTENLVSLHP